MASGIPVIATRCGGTEEIIAPEVGLLVPLNDVNAMADALQTIKFNYQKYDKNIIRNYAFQRYNTEIVTKKYIKLFIEII